MAVRGGLSTCSAGADSVTSRLEPADTAIPTAERSMSDRVGACLFVLFAVICGVPIAFAQSDPVSIFRQAIEARNRGDLDGMMQFFASDAMREDGSCQPPCVGAASVRRSFEKNIAEHFYATLTSVEGSGGSDGSRGDSQRRIARPRGRPPHDELYDQVQGWQDRELVLTVAGSAGCGAAQAVNCDRGVPSNRCAPSGGLPQPSGGGAARRKTLRFRLRIGIPKPSQMKKG